MSTDKMRESASRRLFLSSSVFIGVHRWLNSCSLCVLCVLCGSFFTGGCASAVQAGTSTALDATDLQHMTDRMAMSLAADPEVRQAIAEKGRLKVVVEPVVNQMRAEVLPRGPSEAFMARLRVLLSRHAPESFMWIMNRDAYHRLRQQELGVDLGPSPESVNPEYALVARFNSLADESSKRRTSYYLAAFELINLQTRNVLWSDAYEVKKVAVKGFLD